MVSKLTTCMGIGVILLVSTWVVAQEATSEANIERTRTSIEQWVETRRIISKERQDWALGKEMLNDRIELVQREIESLEGKIKETQKSISDADKKRVELVEENEALKDAAQALAEMVTAFETRTLALNQRLPDPLRERLKPLSQRIPQDASTTKLSLSQRFQNVVGMLNEINKFNREITVTSEMRLLPDGGSAEVTAVYVGLGQAYYTGANGTIAGVGRPAQDGWYWEQANDVAAEISDVVSILKNEKVAGYVPVPVKIQ